MNNYADPPAINLCALYWNAVFSMHELNPNTKILDILNTSVFSCCNVIHVHA